MRTYAKVFCIKTFVVKPVKKFDTYGIFVLFADYKFIISTKGIIPLFRIVCYGPTMLDPTTVTQKFNKN